MTAMRFYLLFAFSWSLHVDQLCSSIANLCAKTRFSVHLDGVNYRLHVLYALYLLKWNDKIIVTAL